MGSDYSSNNTHMRMQCQWMAIVTHGGSDSRNIRKRSSVSYAGPGAYFGTKTVTVGLNIWTLLRLYRSYRSLMMVGPDGVWSRRQNKTVVGILRSGFFDSDFILRADCHSRQQQHSMTCLHEWRNAPALCMSCLEEIFSRNRGWGRGKIIVLHSRPSKF